MMMTTKRLFVALGIFFLIQSLSATTVPSGVGLAGSYLERVSGIEALNLNPANIDKKPIDAEYAILSWSLGISNNAFYAGLILGEEGRLLSKKEKKDILDRMYLSAIAKGNAQLLLAGFSVDKWAVSTSINAFGYGRLDKKFFKIILEGNDYGVKYDFSDKTSFAGLLYQDITLGYGGEVINGWFGDYLQYWPDILVGISASYLIGTKMLETDKLQSELLAQALSYDSTEMTQAVVVRQSDKGQGFKSNIGLSSQVYTWDDNHYITAGMSFDNLFSFIKWGKNKYLPYQYDILIDNFEMTTVDTDSLVWTEGRSHTTHFPVTHRMGTKYVYKKMSASFDIEQNFTRHPAFSHTPEMSLGYEYIFGQRWPVQLGYRVPFREFLAAYSLGAAYKSPYFEFGFALSIEDSINYKNTKGLSIASYTKYRFDW